MCSQLINSMCILLIYLLQHETISVFLLYMHVDINDIKIMIIFTISTKRIKLVSFPLSVHVIWNLLCSQYFTIALWELFSISSILYLTCLNTHINNSKVSLVSELMLKLLLFWNPSQYVMAERKSLKIIIII